MYARIARFRRVVHAGSLLQLMIAIVAACALTLGVVSVASARTSLYASATRAHRSRRSGNKDSKPTPPVVTDSGPVRGTLNGDTAEFLGIPYAAPPSAASAGFLRSRLANGRAYATPSRSATYAPKAAAAARTVCS